MKEGWGTRQGQGTSPHFPSPETSEGTLFQGPCFPMPGVICPQEGTQPRAVGCAGWASLAV